jgi:hypothetical protein
MRHPFAGPTEVVASATRGSPSLILGSMVFAGHDHDQPQELADEHVLEHIAAGLMKRQPAAPSGPAQDTPATTAMIREEGGRPTTLALGEEGSGRGPGMATTTAFPEEGAGRFPAASTRAFGEE